MKDFLKYFTEAEEKNKALGTKISMGDGNDYEPFHVSGDPKSEHYGKNKNLAPIIKAFKEGANWGWSKDSKTGEDKPVKITGKKLYMVGGSVRDHLSRKTPKNVDLATDASPDEIYKLLTQNNFEFLKDKNEKSPKNCFWVERKDTKGRPFCFGIKVKEDTYKLSLFTKNSKGDDSEILDVKPGTIEDDASSRDFTMNALAIPLSNDNGPNKELSDFFGGVYHLKDGKVIPIGDLNSKLKEDPIRAQRFARMTSRYGRPNEIPNEYKDTIKKFVTDLDKKNLNKDKVRDEFMKGINYDDTDPRSYLSLYNDLGLLNLLFPGVGVNADFPKELSELGDKLAPIAWMLRNDNPQNIEKTLKDYNWDKNDLRKILFLIKSLGIDPNTDHEYLDDLTRGYMGTGISSRKTKDWLTKIGGKDEKLANAFIKHLTSPRIKEDMNEHSSNRKLLEWKRFMSFLNKNT